MGAKESALANGGDEAETIEDVVGQLIGTMQVGGQRLDGPYRAQLWESNSSIQTTIPKAALDRFDTDLEELGKRSHYVDREHGLLIIDFEGEFQE